MDALDPMHDGQPTRSPHATARRFRAGRGVARAAACAAALALLSPLTGCFLSPHIAEERTRRTALDYFTAGQDFEARGEYVAALDAYAKAIELSPRAAMYYHAGVCHARLGHREQALEYLDRALALVPDYPLARAERDLLAGQTRLEESALAGTNATRAQGNVAPEATQQPATGVAAAGAATPVVPETAVVVADFATTTQLNASARELGATPEEIRRALFPELYDPAGGKSSAAPATTGSPATAASGDTPAGAPGVAAPGGSPSAGPGLVQFPPSRDELADLAERANRLEQAAYYLEKKVAESPNDALLRQRLARIYARAGRLGRAEAELEKATELDPRNPALWQEWGGFYVRQEDWYEAERCFRRALEIDPNYARSRNNLAVTLLRLGQTEEAAREFETTTRQAPNFASPYLNLAIIEARDRGNIDKAIAHCEQYLRLEGPRAAEVKRWRQDLLLKRKAAEPTPAE